MDPIMQALTSVLCLHYRPDSTLQYKRCVHLWNNFPCITTSVLMMNSELPVFLTYRIYNFCLFDSFLDQTFFRTRAVISKISNTSWRNRRGVARGIKMKIDFVCLSHPQAIYKCPQKISAHWVKPEGTYKQMSCFII